MYPVFSCLIAFSGSVFILLLCTYFVRTKLSTHQFQFRWSQTYQKEKQTNYFISLVLKLVSIVLNNTKILEYLFNCGIYDRLFMKSVVGVGLDGLYVHRFHPVRNKPPYSCLAKKTLTMDRSSVFSDCSFI